MRLRGILLVVAFAGLVVVGPVQAEEETVRIAVDGEAVSIAVRRDGRAFFLIEFVRKSGG